MLRRRVAVVITFAALGIGASFAWSTNRASADTWSDWSCAWNVYNYQVTGGTISGRGCSQTLQTQTPNLFRWAVWADTYAPNSYLVYTYVRGSDTCGGYGGTFTTQMATQANSWNTNYGTSGRAEGNYQNCGPFSTHVYRIYSEHYIQRYSWSNFEGTYGFHYR